MSSPIVVLTGCNGLIGQSVARRLATRYQLVGLDVTDPPSDSAVQDTRYTDLTSDLSVRQSVDHLRARYGGRIASVVHLAAYYDFTGEPSPLYEKITVKGTERLLAALRDFDVAQFVFSSTMLVHAPVPPGDRIDEASPLDPRWAYPRSKLRTERLIEERHGGIPYLHLRIAGVYTDWGTQPTLVQQIKRIHQQELTSFFFPGNSRAGQALVHVDDVADAIVRSVDRRDALPADTAILVGEPDPPSYRGLQEEIGELIWKQEWPTIRLPEAVAEAGAWLQEHTPGAEPFIRPFMIELADDHYGLDIGRARELLGWEPDHRLLDDLPDIVERLRRDPAAWYERNGLEAPDDLPAPSGVGGGVS